MVCMTFDGFVQNNRVYDYRRLMIRAEELKGSDMTTIFMQILDIGLKLKKKCWWGRVC